MVPGVFPPVVALFLLDRCAKESQPGMNEKLVIRHSPPDEGKNFIEEFLAVMAEGLVAGHSDPHTDEV